MSVNLTQVQRERAIESLHDLSTEEQFELIEESQRNDLHSTFLHELDDEDRAAIVQAIAESKRVPVNVGIKLESFMKSQVDLYYVEITEAWLSGERPGSWSESRRNAQLLADRIRGREYRGAVVIAHSVTSHDSHAIRSDERILSDVFVGTQVIPDELAYCDHEPERFDGLS